MQCTESITGAGYCKSVCLLSKCQCPEQRGPGAAGTPCDQGRAAPALAAFETEIPEGRYRISGLTEAYKLPRQRPRSCCPCRARPQCSFRERAFGRWRIPNRLLAGWRWLRFLPAGCCHRAGVSSCRWRRSLCRWRRAVRGLGLGARLGHPKRVSDGPIARRITLAVPPPTPPLTINPPIMTLLPVSTNARVLMFAELRGCGLIQVIHFHNADAGAVVLALKNGGIGAGSERGDDG